MKKYLIKVEGSNGDPGNNYHYNLRATESDLFLRIADELKDNCPGIDNELEDSSIGEIVESTIENGYHSYQGEWGYGIEYELTIEEL